MTELPPKNHNNPPGMIEIITQTMGDLSDWMKENPVIESTKSAQEAKILIDRAKLGIKDLEDERDGKVRPLNEKVKAINESYRTPRELLERVYGELGERLRAFILAEEARRLEAAREAARIAQEAELRAREAERAEQEAIRSAYSGVLDVDVAANVVEADDAFRAYQKAERQAAIAQKETKVKITGGFSRAIGLKTETTLIVSDILAAVGAMKTSESIIEAVVKSARAYKRVCGEYPPGITVETERKV